MGRYTDEGGLPAEVQHQVVGGAALARVRARHPVTTVTSLRGLHRGVHVCQPPGVHTQYAVRVEQFTKLNIIESFRQEAMQSRVLITFE